jgi:predicted nucleic acid-binding protein
MSLLVDTNVLLRSVEPGHPSHRIASRTLIDLIDQVVISTQSLYEFWVVATRPLTANGLGMSSESVRHEIDRLQLIVERLPETDSIFSIWQDLVTRYAVKGKPAHDAHIVAAMLAHDVHTIVTFNTADFRRYSEIRALTPAEALASESA